MKIALFPACVVIAVLAASPLHAIDFGKIMPLGDSITKGTTVIDGTATTVPGGYRDPLYTRLTGAGHKLTFVGSETINPGPALTTAGQINHEGHGGYLIDGTVTVDAATGTQKFNGLAENLPTWLGNGGASPDIVLLMIGTNDIGKGYGTGATGRLDALIRAIDSYLPKASIYVASLAPRPQSTSVANAVAAFNAAVPGIVNGCVADGTDVHFVDAYAALSTNPTSYLCEDKLHPNAAGYAKIADVWYNALTASAVPEPGPITMLVIAGMALLVYAKGKCQ